MKRFLFTLALCLLPSIAWAQCTGQFPAGTFCGNPGPGAGPPKPLIATGGTILSPGSTTVGDIATWGNTTGTLLSDQAPTTTVGWTPATNVGVDCTATTDSTSALQTWINANLNGGHLRFPSGCHLKTSSTLTITNAINIVFEGAEIAGSGNTPPVQWDWVGTNGGAACATTYSSCVFVMDFEHSDHPTVQNIYFEGLTNCPDGFLKFDGNPSGHIGTSGRILHNHFSAGSCSNKNFVAVDISRTATSNHENYLVQDNSTFCSNSVPNNIAADIVTNGTTTITSASNPFVVGNVGHRIRLTFSNATNPGNHPGTSGPFSRGYFDTTIAGFTNSGTVTLTSPVTFTANPVQGTIDGGVGVAYRNGASQNAIQQTFSNLQYSNCAFGVFITGGGVQISQVSDGFSDVGVFFGGFIAQNTTLDYYASEADYIAVMQQPGANPPLEISNSRFSNGVASGFGFLQLGGSFVTIKNSLVNFGVPNSNSVLIAPYAGISVSTIGTITGGSGYVNNTYTSVPLTGGGSSGVQATVVVSGGAVTSVTITNAGSGSPFPVVGDVLTTSNSNLGGSGSGFSVPVTATTETQSNDAFATIISFNNDWNNGCCFTTISPTNLGFTLFQQHPPIQYGDTIASFTQSFNFSCTSLNCLYVQNQADNGQTGVGIIVNSANSISQANNTIGFRSTATGGIGTNYVPGSVSHVGFQMYPPNVGSPTTMVGFDAGWNAAALPGAGTAVYGFRAETPSSISSGPLASLYGFECDRQKIASVTAGWCFYNANINDQNFFAGPVLLGNSGLTVSGGSFGMAKITASAAAPGAAGGKIELVCGTNAGTAKLIAYAGTSATSVTILDNIGSGVTGC